MLDPRTPIIVGTGQVTDRAPDVESGREPAALMAEAISSAANDAGLDAAPTPDSLRVVSLLSWRYVSPASCVADMLGIAPRELAVSTPGGNSPQTLVNETALSIQRGDLDLVVLTGAESWRTRMRARRNGVDPAWTTQDNSARLDRVIGSDLDMTHPDEGALGIRMPVQVYPMFETAIRAAAGRSVTEHRDRIAELWSRFSHVAARNPYAWAQSALTAEEISTVGPRNRMIGYPYTKVMNSNNDVDQAAAVMMCSVEKATSLGIPRDRWIFIHAGSDCHEHPYVSNRWTFAETPAVALGGRRALELAGVGIDDIDIVDLYSCFPSAVQLGAQSLGLDIEAQLTRTGGLSFAGGPWNNYVMHAIATVSTELRSLPDGARGLVWANGGFTTKHAFGVYSNAPSGRDFAHAYPQDEIDAMPARMLATGDDGAGPATIEAYSVMHDRDGMPETGYVACLRADGRRVWARTRSSDLARDMCEGEWVGRSADVSADALLEPR